jgi:hypothetical protein
MWQGFDKLIISGEDAQVARTVFSKKNGPFGNVMQFKDDPLI